MYKRVFHFAYTRFLASKSKPSWLTNTALKNTEYFAAIQNLQYISRYFQVTVNNMLRHVQTQHDFPSTDEENIILCKAVIFETSATEMQSSDSEEVTPNSQQCVWFYDVEEQPKSELAEVS